ENFENQLIENSSKIQECNSIIGNLKDKVEQIQQIQSEIVGITAQLETIKNTYEENFKEFQDQLETTATNQENFKKEISNKVQEEVQNSAAEFSTKVQSLSDSNKEDFENIRNEILA